MTKGMIRAVIRRPLGARKARQSLSPRVVMKLAMPPTISSRVTSTPPRMPTAHRTAGRFSTTVDPGATHCVIGAVRGGSGAGVVGPGDAGWPRVDRTWSPPTWDDALVSQEHPGRVDVLVVGAGP